MDTAKLWVTLLCVCGSWILSLAINCDWITEYEFENRCCKACPSGQYPKVPCQGNNKGSVCEECSPKLASAMDRCFCNNNHLCMNDKCNICEPRPRCKPGHQLNRSGEFDYSFICEPCPENTYNDAEDSMCKSITKCEGVGKIFPGNQTHNARCTPSVVPNNSSVTTDPGKQENKIQSTHSFMVACLTVTVLTCLVFIIYTAFQIFKYKMLIKLRKKPCRHVLPSDSCKLSKEEKGEECDFKTEVSEEYSKSDIYGIH
ncbi:tumor necrosis factor receptor superfamily member 18 [Megalobrama amblycephala]|uniref:tumor necrosis factor receptor superfamily member 18 n=1 Tax=Megalobrama amblycephala TaxID=75352 RepID=UPI0020141B0B|nr:tumor necrosis factor receptor superfamily member 18 [Megalobrama amblycephala]